MWTKEQIEAINITGVNTSVSASAGAGKTAVLVERLMKRILKDNVSVDEIVSLTFTDAAAAEMKNRLMSALLDAYDKDPTNTYLYDQITLLPSAQITTIHSFCLNILKNHYYALNLNPDSLNNIISDADDLSLQKQAFETVLNVYDKNKSSEVLEFISSSALSLNRLNAMIHDFSLRANSTIDPQKFLYDSIKIYDNYESVNDIPEPFYTMFWTYHFHHVSNLKEILNTAYRELDLVEEAKKTDAQRAWISEGLIYLDNAEEAINDHDYTLYYHAILDLASLKNTLVRSEPNYKKARDEFYDVLSDLGQILYSESDLLKNLSLNKEVLTYFIEMTSLYNESYKQGLKDLNCITFNDMETLTYRLLKANNEEVAKSLRLEISDILVDEFQDTNELQNEIITLISNGHNIFRVGDVKQSIYRFRGAEPTIMQNLISQEDSDEHKTIYLSNNFRSKKSIVEYNNHFFDKLMNLERFNSAYIDSDWVKVGLESQEEDSVPVELHRLNVSANQHLDNFSLNDFKATYIASKIVELYNEDPKKRWNRFTVLVSSHSRKLELKKAFDVANIPYFISLPDGLYTSDGVSTIHAYLKLVFDPSDKISLMAVLKNLYHFSDNEITELFLETKSLHEVSNRLNETLLKDVYTFNKQQTQVPIQDIVNHVLSINDFYESSLSKQNRVNVDIFYDLVLQYDQQSLGLYGLLKQIDQALDAKSQEGSSISSEDNVVNVMTIHNSKGLQFETVFLFSKDRAYTPSLSQGYLLHPQYGLAIKSLDVSSRIQYENIPHTLIRYFDKLESIEEDMRTLYVALTRAQNELYIIDTIKTKDDELPKVEVFDDKLVIASTYTKWLESAHHSYPTLDLKYHVEDDLEILHAEKIEPEVKTIRHLPLQDSKDKTYKKVFEIESLKFSEGIDATDIGTLVHNTLEALPQGSWTSDLIKEISPKLSDYYIQRLINLSNNEYFRELQNHTVYKEYPFIINKDNQRQRGIIDYLVETDSEIFIIDFKTDALDSESEFIERYYEQLSFYKESLRLAFSEKEISAQIYSFRLETFIPIH